MTRISILLASSCILAVPAHAQSQSAPAQPARSASPHEDAQEIIVTADFVRSLDILSGTSSLGGAELLRELRPQIGETLARQPGVSATSFSPGASRPVLRGFQGERVRVLTDGIGSIDVSNTSADHAVTIDPLTADRIEVLHGPAVLLFGSQAIGGAVNVLDRRIPREIPERGFHLDLTGALGSAADERSIGGAADVSLGGGFVAHVDGSLRKTDDQRIGGYLLSPELRAEQRTIAEEETEEGHLEEAEEALELAESRGRLPNSATEQKSAGAGLAYIGDRGSLGVSVGWFDSDYGVPMRPGSDHHHEEEGEEGEEEGGHEHGEEPVTIGLEQVRADLRGRLELDGFFDQVRLRAGYADYEHTEFEGDEVGTIFSTRGAEGRLELVQADRNGWRGVSGLQASHRDFEAVGAEAFLPKNQTTQFGLFTLQELKLGRFELDGSLRYERTHVEADELDVERRFSAFSVALGGSYEVAPHVRIGINGSRTERAPSAEELFSNGPHVATQAYELGNPDLAKEKSWGAEAFVHAESGPFHAQATIFANWFDDYIFQSETGEEEDELPVLEYLQDDARYLGFEAALSATVVKQENLTVTLDGVADYVRATIAGGGPVPRIPPLRLLGGIEADTSHLGGRLEVEWVADQERVAEHETPTDGHTLVNASVSWRPWGKDRESMLILSANNIFDVDARRHASFTKDFVPLPGRDIRLSARFSF
jgi:iron complex outermembrane receptor protein